MAGVAPGKTFTPGLDFSGQSYSNLARKVEADVSRANEIIKEKLPLLGELKALLQISFGDNPPFFIDARSGTASILASTKDEPDTKLNIKPEYIAQFYDGKLEPRYGLFKDAFFNQASMPSGSIPVAIKFADLVTPNPPVPPKHADAFVRLPKPTEDIEQVKRDIKEFGYGLVKSVLTPEQCAIMKKAVQEQAAGEREAGIAQMDGGPQGPNQRLWTLVNKGEDFLDLLNHPIIDEMIPWFLGEHAIITTYTANIARPGNLPMQLHTDQVAVQPPIRDLAFGMNIMFYLEDVTEKNGGTRVYPGSHLGQVAPPDIFTVEGTAAAAAPAGSALVFESRLWHATGPNREAAGERPVILLFFMRSFIRQQENNFLSLRKDVWPKLSDRVKRMLGFYTTGALGGVDGEVREGLFVEWKEGVGKMRAPHKG
ncbi:hypothetical protein INS49_005607 [Diaporthe citri]|uniref:uncharacterized protein n=1 Tax=Diaporthe citri TaxID=83186 RepID=UPI001C7FF607|nr:uncharacterized protein INS49_005607 [Diaporthe citri]KAG6353426.1 hypothetical protein INS49_005607 [Diaporthe citri]